MLEVAHGTLQKSTLKLKPRNIDYYISKLTLMAMKMIFSKVARLILLDDSSWLKGKSFWEIRNNASRTNY